MRIDLSEFSVVFLVSFCWNNWLLLAGMCAFDIFQVIKTHLRNMVIVPEMIGSIVGVYNGKTFNQVEIKVNTWGMASTFFRLKLQLVCHLNIIFSLQKHVLFSIFCRVKVELWKKSLFRSHPRAQKTLNYVADQL